jgi:hypothetical protein
MKGRGNKPVLSGKNFADLDRREEFPVAGRPYWRVIDGALIFDTTFLTA